MRPLLPLCVCDGVLLFMAPAAINHELQRCGKTVRARRGAQGGEVEGLTVDGPMKHHAEAEEEICFSLLPSLVVNVLLLFCSSITHNL